MRWRPATTRRRWRCAKARCCCRRAVVEHAGRQFAISGEAMTVSASAPAMTASSSPPQAAAKTVRATSTAARGRNAEGSSRGRKLTAHAPMTTATRRLHRSSSSHPSVPQPPQGGADLLGRVRSDRGSRRRLGAQDSDGRGALARTTGGPRADRPRNRVVRRRWRQTTGLFALAATRSGPTVVTTTTKWSATAPAAFRY